MKKKAEVLAGVALAVALIVCAILFQTEKKETIRITKEVWSASVYNMIEDVHVTHWQGSLIFQMPKNDGAPVLIAVPSCEHKGEGAYGAYQWWALNSGEGQKLLVTDVKVQKDGTSVWIFSPPSLSQGKTRTREYLDHGKKNVIRVEMLRIEVIEDTSSWVVRSVDRLKKNDAPWVTHENYFYVKRLLVYQENTSSASDLRLPDRNVLKGPGLHLQYGNKHPFNYGFSKLCH
ncbi:hypothetical protein KJ903_04845 [Patescibacteria group bacterium]|nr:hypothetical protein [Patescibacteria group bacterium]